MKKLTDRSRSDYELDCYYNEWFENEGRLFFIHAFRMGSKYTVSYFHKNGVHLNAKEFESLEDAEKYLNENYLDLILGDRTRIGKLSSIEQKENFIKKFNL
jgi:hypothetical protein